MRSKTFFYFSLLITVVIFVALIYAVQPFKILNAIQNLRPDLVLIAFLIYPLSFILRGMRFEIIMKEIGYRAGYGFAVMAVAISQTLNVITPVRVGDLGRAYIYKRREIPYQSSLSCLAAERIYDVIAIILIALFSIVFVSLEFLDILIYAAAFLLLVLIAVAVLSRTRGYVARIMIDTKSVVFSGNTLKLLPISLCIWLMDVLTCYIIVQSFAAVSLPLPAFAVAAGNIAKTLPITPGGIGTYEATVTLILSTKLPKDQALVVSFVDHTIKNVSTLVMGLVSSLKLGISFKDVRV